MRVTAVTDPCVIPSPRPRVSGRIAVTAALMGAVVPAVVFAITGIRTSGPGSEGARS